MIPTQETKIFAAVNRGITNTVERRALRNIEKYCNLALTFVTSYDDERKSLELILDLARKGLEGGAKHARSFLL